MRFILGVPPVVGFLTHKTPPSPPPSLKNRRYWHTRGSVDCGPAQGCPATGGTAAECCCACHADYYCPGGAKNQPELPCPAGSSSPPDSTSESACTGGPPPPPGGSFSQVHIAYTGKPALLSVDFVGGSGAVSVFTSVAGGPWRQANATSFAHPTIGYMNSALLDFSGVAAGATARYVLGSTNGTVFSVVPIVARAEVFAVYGDFGTANDVCLPALIAGAAAGEYDAVLHVGDWAYNMEDNGSQVGNTFMNYIQAYAATHPVMPADGK